MDLVTRGDQVTLSDIRISKGILAMKSYNENVGRPSKSSAKLPTTSKLDTRKQAANKNQATHLVPSGANLEDWKQIHRRTFSRILANISRRVADSVPGFSAIWCQVGAKKMLFYGTKRRFMAKNGGE